MPLPKIAVVHDWLTAPGGAERVLYQILSLLPSSDLFTLIDDRKTLPDHIRQRHRIEASFLNRLPRVHSYYRWLSPIMPWAIESLDLSKYDFVVSSSWAFAHGVETRNQATHIAYVHSPMRWAWDMEDEYLNQAGFNAPLRQLVQSRLSKLRSWDRVAAQRPAKILTNSQFVQQRIQDCWQRDAGVIYPPVSVTKTLQSPVDHDAYVTVSRLVSYKRVDLWIEAFRKLPNKKLIVAGAGPELGQLRSSAPTNVQFTGQISDQQTFALMAGAKALLQASKEDFGISVVEAQACGTPVIAYGQGGALETVRGIESKNPTGLLFDDLSIEALTDAIQTFEKLDFSRQDCVQNAERFSAEKFRTEFTKNLIANGLDRSLINEETACLSK